MRCGDRRDSNTCMSPAVAVDDTFFSRAGALRLWRAMALPSPLALPRVKDHTHLDASYQLTNCC